MRVRIFPVHCRQQGDPSHYVVVDDAQQGVTSQDCERLRRAVPVPVMIFSSRVDLPDVGFEA